MIFGDRNLLGDDSPENRLDLFWANLIEELEDLHRLLSNSNKLTFCRTHHWDPELPQKQPAPIWKLAIAGAR